MLGLSRSKREDGTPTFAISRAAASWAFCPFPQLHFARNADTIVYLASSPEVANTTAGAYFVKRICRRMTMRRRIVKLTTPDD